MLRLLLCLVVAGPALAHPTQDVRAIFENGNMVYHGGNQSVETPFAIASAGKLLTSLAFLRLAEQGKIAIDDPVSKWVPQNIAVGLGGLDGIDLHHLATMTAGLPDYYGDRYFDTVEDTPISDQSAEFAVSLVFGEDLEFKPGTAFAYSNTNYLLLQIAMERAAGQPYHRIIQDQIISPAKLENTVVFGNDPIPRDFPEGHEGRTHIRAYYQGPGYGDGGVLSSAADMARLYTAMWDGTLLTDASIDHLLTDPAGEGYGMGLVLDGDLVGHSGGDLGFSSLIAMNWETGRVAVELVGQADGASDWAWDAVAD